MVEKSSGTVVIVGLALGASCLGMVLMFLLARRLLQQPALAPAQQPGLGWFGPQRAIGAAPAALPALRGGGASWLDTVTLTSSRASYITEVGDRPVAVRVVGPAGAYARFATATQPLELPGNGRSFIIPAGDEQRLPLKPGEKVYGIGSVDGVIVSTVA